MMTVQTAMKRGFTIPDLPADASVGTRLFLYKPLPQRPMGISYPPTESCLVQIQTAEELATVRLVLEVNERNDVGT